MWYIVVYDVNGQDVGQAIIEPEVTVSVGSDPECPVVIYDPSVLPVQLFIYLAEGYPVIEDSSGGNTLMDGFPITQPSYFTTDNVITFGNYTLYVYFDESQGEGVVPGAGIPVAGGEDEPPPPPPPESMDEQAGMLEAGSDYAAAAPVNADFAPVAQANAVELGTDAVPAVESRALKLVAREGYLDGKEFLLMFDDFFDLGRSRDADLVVDDPSVSRVHARLTIEEGGTLLVQDLRSTNGTFINGKEVKRDVATLGDRIRFGEVPFLFTTVKSEAQDKVSAVNPQNLLKSKKIVFIAMGIVLFFGLFMIIKIAKKHRPKPKKQKIASKASIEETLKARVARIKAEASELTRVDKWDEAISKYREALSIIPDDKEVKRALVHAKFERTNYRIFQEALNYKNQMTHSGRIKALAKFKEIDKSSQYYRSELSPIIMELKQELAKHYRDEGLARYKANYFKDAFNNLCHYFELDAKVDTISQEAKYRRILKKLARKFRNSKKIAPCTAKRFLEARVPLTALWAEKARKALMKKYPDKHLANAIMLYFNGNPKEAILELKSLTKTRRGRRKYAKYLQTIIELQSQFQTIIQSYEAGETEIQQGDIKGALKEWKTVLKIDASIIPEGIKSRYRKNISNRLAQYYYQYGKKSLDLYRYEEAFAMFKKGLELSPDDTTELREGIKQLEQKASEFMEDAIQFQDSNPEEAKKLLRKIIKITMPDSPTHKKAKKALGL